MASSFVAVPAPEGGYRPLKGEDPFPLVAPAESTPLVLKREGLACAKSVLSRGFVVGVVACALCVWALAALRSAGVARRRRGAAPAARRHKYCVAHAAYGDYLPVAEITAASKRSYANARGYAFHELLGATREDYVAAHCPELGAQIHGAFSKTTPVKACGSVQETPGFSGFFSTLEARISVSLGPIRLLLGPLIISARVLEIWTQTSLASTRTKSR